MPDPADSLGGETLDGDVTTPVISVETTNTYLTAATSDEVNEELDDVKISTSLKILCLLMILGCCTQLVRAGFFASLGYTVVGVFDLAIVICQATITWGIFQLRLKAIIYFYCLVAFWVFVNIFYYVAQVSPEFEVPLNVLAIVQCFARPLTTAVMFTAFIWPNRKLFV